MRKLLCAVLAAVSCLGGLVALSSTPVAAAPGFDASVALSDSPDPVSPVGGTTIYKVTATATGLAPLFPASLTVTNNGGLFSTAGTNAPGCTIPAEGTADPVVTCELTLNAGPKTIYVAIRSVSAGTMSSTGTVQYEPAGLDPIVDDDPSNDSSTESTTVTNDNSSATYLQEGQSTTFQGHKLTVTDSDSGVITELRTAPVTGDGAATCGVQGPCKQGLRVLFYENTVYTGNVRVTVTYGWTHPCGYYGESATCKYLYYRKASTGDALPVPKCVLATDTLCYEKKYFSAGAWRIDVRMDSNDPDLLSPVKGITTGT